LSYGPVTLLDYANISSLPKPCQLYLAQNNHLHPPYIVNPAKVGHGSFRKKGVERGWVEEALGYRLESARSDNSAGPSSTRRSLAGLRSNIILL